MGFGDIRGGPGCAYRERIKLVHGGRELGDDLGEQAAHPGTLVTMPSFRSTAPSTDTFHVR
ncbi:hypothetical protein GCM10029963_66080 [Micromonospora andamanensis]|nr:hypothetical protein Vwe01_04980 [Micromonospora andamanensis]